MASEQSAARLIPEWGVARTALVLLFAVWGGVGLLIVFFEVMATNSMTTIGVGQSAYVTMHLGLYLAGTVFFGLSALLSGAAYDFRRLDPVVTTKPQAAESETGWKSGSALKK